MCSLKTLLCFLNLMFFVFFFYVFYKKQSEIKHVFPIFFVLYVFENIKQFSNTINKQARRFLFVKLFDKNNMFGFSFFFLLKLQKTQKKTIFK